MRRYGFLFFILALIAACEPIVPDNGQQIIIVTNTPTIAPPASATPLFATPLPTRALPSPTPTLPIFPTATVPSCDETSGRLFESAFNSTIADGLIAYNVYMPPCFFLSGRRYPLLMLLHGSGYTYTQWTDLNLQAVLDSGIAAGTLPPMMVVMPEGGLYQENNFFEEGASFEDILLTELLPALERDFCLWDAPSARAIGGISRGGFWAYSIAFRHPEIFGVVGGHSPFFVPDNAPPSHNPLALAETATSIEGLRIYLDNSQNDIGGPNVIVFSNTLRGRGIVHTYTIHPTGNHDNDYWSSHLEDYLNFYGQEWPLSAEELPSCE